MTACKPIKTVPATWYELAEQQRFEALTNAFKTIHAFADASLSPDEHKGLEKAEQKLKKMYRPKVLLKDRVKNILKTKRMVTINSLKIGQRFKTRHSSEIMKVCGKMTGYVDGKGVKSFEEIRLHKNTWVYPVK